MEVNKIMSGFFTISRKLKDNFLYPTNEGRKFTKYEAWIWLIENANYFCKEKCFDYKRIVVPRGYLDITVEQLSFNFMWDRRTTEKFLKMLEKQKQIMRFKTSNSRKACTLIKVNNYNAFQLPVADKCTLKRKLKCKSYCTLQCKLECPPYNNDNNINKENNGNNIYIKKISPESQEINQIIDLYKKYFNKIYRLSFEEKTTICHINNQEEYTLDDWETIFKNASKGWMIKNEKVKPALSNILSNYSKFLNDDYNLGAENTETTGVYNPYA